MAFLSECSRFGIIDDTTYLRSLAILGYNQVCI